MNTPPIVEDPIEQIFENLSTNSFLAQQLHLSLAQAIIAGDFTDALQYEFVVRKIHLDFFRLLNDVPARIRLDQQMLIRKFIRNMNDAPSGEPARVEMIAYAQFKREHNLEGKNLDEILDLSAELAEQLVIKRMTEDGLFLLHDTEE